MSPKSSVAIKSFPTFPFKSLRLLLALALVFASLASTIMTAGGQAPGQTLVFPASIQWPRQRGVTWYRLQIGGDETFRDVYVDRRVVGDRYQVRDLEPGYYYWRIAPADSRLGEFSRPLRFFVPGGVVMPRPVRSSSAGKP